MDERSKASVDGRSEAIRRQRQKVIHLLDAAANATAGYLEICKRDNCVALTLIRFAPRLDELRNTFVTNSAVSP